MKFVIVICDGYFKFCFILLNFLDVLFCVVMKLELVIRKNVSHVELEKDAKCCLGMTIADGSKDEAGPVVKKVKSKGPAGRSFAVSEGDVILSFNGNSAVGTKSKDIIRMIRESGSSVEFKLQYELREIRISQPVVYRRRQRKIVLYKVGDNFGFVLRKEGSVNLFTDDYPVISNIKAGSYVQRHGLIQDGDRLVKVDDVSLSCTPLPEIARLLQARCKAEFVYQYEVGMIEFPEPGRKVSLDIDVPIEDLGICLSSESEDSGLMYIDKIRLGSIAERCGLFSEGDIILSIDEIDATFLTVSKASTLLQNCKKCRKISFIPGKRKRVSPLREKCIDERGTRKIDSITNKPYKAGRNINTSECQSIQSPSKQGFFLKKLCLSDQMKSIYYLQNIVKVIRRMKEIQSEAKEEKKFLNAGDYCAFCDGRHDFTKFCHLFLSKVNVACAQSIDMLQNIVSHFIFRSFTELQEGKLEANLKEKEIRDSAVIKVNKLELLHALTETLPDIFVGDDHLKERLLAIAKKIYHVDATCSICDLKVRSIWITVQKILLLLSVDYRSHESKILINRLLSCLLKADLSCTSLTVFKSDVCRNFQHQSSIATSSVHCMNDSKLSDSDCYSIQTDFDLESIGVRTPVESSLTNPHVYMQKDYLKITHIQSVCISEESSSDEDLCEADKDAKTVVGNSPRFSCQENNLKRSSSFLKNENAASNGNEKFNDGRVFNRAPVKLWRSLDSILKSVGADKDQPDVSQRFSQNASKCKVTKTNGMNQNVPGTSSSNAANRLPANHKPPTNGGCSSEFNGSNPSSSNSSKKNGQCHSNKIRTDTIEVKMSNSGEGFGLGLGLKFISSKSSVLPVIESIQPRSPSQRTGVLKIGDGIVAVNRRSTLGLTPQQLQNLQKKAFLADAISLTVDFDVVDAELKVGTFDVVLDKTLKIGLLFEDMQRGYPMVVSGVVKGSGAHRCGQLFPGDQITFFRCIRNEEFDPVSCNYSKEESVLITVRRDRIEGVREKPANASPCYVNPCFSHKDSVPRRGQAFVVNSSAIHVVDGTDSLVLDQDVTLFRDPVSWDFGFLVGENPDTGRAYVTDVRPGGPASKSGVMKKFDRILEVNGVSVNKNLKHSVLSLLSQANHKVDLLIRRLYQEDSTIV